MSTLLFSTDEKRRNECCCGIKEMIMKGMILLQLELQDPGEGKRGEAFEIIANSCSQG